MNRSALHVLLPLSLVPALLFGACGGGSSTLGSSCDPNAPDSCGDGLSCSASSDGQSICTISTGESCDLESAAPENHGCAADAVCALPNQSSLALGAGGATPDEVQTVCLLGEGAVCDPNEAFCDADLTCAETTSGDFRCFGRVVLVGDVTDTSDAASIAGAHVLALDKEGSAVTDVVKTDSAGDYILDLPVLRDDSGAPVDTTFTLQGSAQDYQAFPQGVRVALPINTSEADLDGRVYVIENALTQIGLIPLPAATRYRVEGMVSGLSADSNVAGALVVASGAAGNFSAVADLSGHFTIWNVPDGDFTLSVYGAKLQVDPLAVTVDGAKLTGVELAEVDTETTTVLGNIQIVNAPGGSKTSVILVVEDTFDELAARGEVPRGLRAPTSGPVSITGDFTIEGVSAGRYVVLAAYENDGLVRDPDINIAGTGFVHIEISAGEPTYTVQDSFKVTEALETFGPGVDSPEAVTDKPLLSWADDSSEDYYDVRVFDAFGSEVWNSLELPGVSGKAAVELQYDGPLDPGMYYQFRVSSFRASGGGTPSAISSTEDLRGVFFLPAQ